MSTTFASAETRAAEARHAAHTEHEAHARHASHLMHVIARVGTERFAFRVADVEEVLDTPKLLAAPSGPPGLRGQVVHRERTLRAYDGAWALSLVSAADNRTPTFTSGPQ